MDTNPAKEPLNAYGLCGALVGAGIGVAVWYFFLYRPGADDEMRFAMSSVFGLINGALAGNYLGKALRRNTPPNS